MVQDCEVLEELEQECSDRTDEVTRRRFLRVAAAAAGVTPAAPLAAWRLAGFRKQGKTG